jgi:hypothetical protein
MSSILRNFHPDTLFWEANPSVTTINAFNKLKKTKQSSKILWAIALLLDKNEDNPWRNLPEEEKKALIEDEFIEDSTFQWEDYQEQIDAYKAFLMTPAQRALANWENKLLEREEFIRTTSYDESTYKMLDDMQTKTINLYQNYKTIMEMIAMEQSEGVLRGGATESISEKGII